MSVVRTGALVLVLKSSTHFAVYCADNYHQVKQVDVLKSALNS